MKEKHADDHDYYGVEKEYLPPNELEEVFENLLPPSPPRPRGGRPRMSDKKAFYAIFYVLRTGIQWKALPKSLGAASTVHRRFQKWVSIGFFTDLWRLSLLVYDQMVGLEWEWQAMDGAMTKAPLGCENTGPNPTDRAKSGTKRHVLTESHGVPISLVVTGANRNDFKETNSVIENIVIPRPKPTKTKKQNLSLDKGFDYPEVAELLKEYGYTAHIRSRGEEMENKKTIPGYRSRRWVVERTHSWMNRFRRILTRWEKKTENYEAFLHLTCAHITLNATGVFG